MIRVPCYDCAMRWVASICSLLALGSCKDDVYFIPGTGEVPDATKLRSPIWKGRSGRTAVSRSAVRVVT